MYLIDLLNVTTKPLIFIKKLAQPMNLIGSLLTLDNQYLSTYSNLFRFSITDSM